MDKKVFYIEDGESWWVIAENAAQALEIGQEYYGIDEDKELSADDVAELGPDTFLTVGLSEGIYDRDDLKHHSPIWPVYHYYGGRGWSCTATGKQWAEFGKVGDIVASSVY